MLQHTILNKEKEKEKYDTYNTHQENTWWLIFFHTVLKCSNYSNSNFKGYYSHEDQEAYNVDTIMHIYYEISK